MLKIELSSMALTKENFLSKIKNIKPFVEKHNFKFGVQIHNSIKKDFYELLVKELKDYVEFTVHSPLITKYLINLAASDFYNTTLNTAKEAVNYIKFFNIDIFFFHGFFMTEEPILNDINNYRKIMMKYIPAKYRLNNSVIMNPEYFKTEEYFKFQNRVKENFNKLKKNYPEYKIALENDFIGVGSGLQTPQQIVNTVDSLWFDTGHLWCASILHKFDFYEGIDYIIKNNIKILGVHINHNLMTKNTPPEKLIDSHTHLYMHSEQKLKSVVRKLRDYGVNIFTLEILDGDIKDVEILLSWLLD